MLCSMLYPPLYDWQYLTIDRIKSFVTKSSYYRLSKMNTFILSKIKNKTNKIKFLVKTKMDEYQTK